MAAPRFPYTDLKDFLSALENAGELHRVRASVDPTLEISEIVTRTVRAKGPALVFQNPTRGQMPVAMNLFGTHRRMAIALGRLSIWIIRNSMWNWSRSWGRPWDVPG